MTENPIVGKRLNKRRKELGFSLRELAEKTSLTASFLSQLERGVTNSSLKSLNKISEALGVPLLYFLSEDQSQVPVVRADSRSKLDLDDDRVAYELLTPSLTGKLEALIGHIKSGSDNIVRPLSIETEEIIFVLEGILIVGLKDREYTLNPGDSVFFNGRDLVKLTCGGDCESRWLSVITPPVF
jgi:transcriptional regulator with XRE-family HTH domain